MLLITLSLGLQLLECHGCVLRLGLGLVEYGFIRLYSGFYKASEIRAAQYSTLQKKEFRFAVSG